MYYYFFFYILLSKHWSLKHSCLNLPLQTYQIDAKPVQNVTGTALPLKEIKHNHDRENNWESNVVVFKI